MAGLGYWGGQDGLQWSGGEGEAEQTCHGPLVEKLVQSKKIEFIKKEFHNFNRPISKSSTLDVFEGQFIFLFQMQCFAALHILHGNCTSKHWSNCLVFTPSSSWITLKLSWHIVENFMQDSKWIPRTFNPLCFSSFFPPFLISLVRASGKTLPLHEHELVQHQMTNWQQHHAGLSGAVLCALCSSNSSGRNTHGLLNCRSQIYLIFPNLFSYLFPFLCELGSK